MKQKHESDNKNLLPEIWEKYIKNESQKKYVLIY